MSTPQVPEQPEQPEPVQPDELQRSFVEDIAKLTAAGLAVEGVKYGVGYGVGRITDWHSQHHGKHESGGQPEPPPPLPTLEN